MRTWRQRRCATCGGPAYGRQCRACRALTFPGQERRDLHGDWGERKRRKAIVDAWRTTHGEVCPGWRRAPHATGPHNPLTADHALPPGRGFAPNGPLTVLCRSCNGRKAASLHEHEPRETYSSREW